MSEFDQGPEQEYDEYGYRPEDYGVGPDDPCIHGVMAVHAHSTGHMMGALVGALDSAGEQPILVETENLAAVASIVHAFLDGFVESFQEALDGRNGTNWRVSGTMMPPMEELHQIVSVLGASLDKVYEEVHLAHGPDHECAGEDELGSRVVIERMGNEGVSLGFTTEEKLDEHLLERTGTDAPVIRFVGLMDHFGVAVGD